MDAACLAASLENTLVAVVPTPAHSAARPLSPKGEIVWRNAAVGKRGVAWRSTQHAPPPADCPVTWQDTRVLRAEM